MCNLMDSKVNISNLDNLFLTIDNQLNAGVEFSDIGWIIENYKNKDWRKHIDINTTGLSRNRIYLSSNIEVFILSCKSQYETLPHDHSSNGCWLKILSGNLLETLYNKDLKKICIKNIDKNEVSFMHNEFGYHSITNNSDNNVYSIHIYSPPMHKTKYLDF